MLSLLKKVRWIPWVIIAENVVAVALASFWPVVSAVLLGSAFVLTALEGVRALVESNRARARNAALDAANRRR